MVRYCCCLVVELCPTLRSHGLQHSRPPCPSRSPEVCRSSCPLHRIWGTPIMCDAIQPSHPLTSSSPSALSLSQHQGFLPMSWLFASGNQNTGSSASASVLPMSIQGWFPLILTGLISLLSKGLSVVFFSTTVQRHQFFGVLPSLWSSSHNRMWPQWKTITLTVQTFVDRVMSQLNNTLSRFIKAFLSRSNCLLSLCLHLPSAVVLEPKK